MLILCKLILLQLNVINIEAGLLYLNGAISVIKLLKALRSKLKQ